MKRQIFWVLGVAILVAGCSASRSTEMSNVVIPTVVPSGEVVKMYSMDEVAKHVVEDDCWMVIEEGIYDVSAFVDDHPGGREILEGCGQDATEMFNGEREHHEENAGDLLPPYRIGELQK